MRVNIIGAGLSGLSAAICLARQGVPCRLISVQHSERAQSCLAAGGINAALDTMGEGDSVEAHAEDTLRAGCDIADPEGVKAMTRAAPELLRELAEMGVPFNRGDSDILLRNFGGQKKKRTAFSGTSTGKMLMTALIDACRGYECAGLVERYAHHRFERLLTDDNICRGALVSDLRGGGALCLTGPVILACGGMNGMFPRMTTGTTANTGDAAAMAFYQGVRFGNLEMIQYHPTTYAIADKRCLVSEAARSEGGRLYVLRDGKPWYFMEEKYPEFGNLMPRDVVSREMAFLIRTGDQVCLDMRGVRKNLWQERLADLRAEIRHYLNIDPARTPVPVAPGIHYFMGGVDVDGRHRTSAENLYAVGECCCRYHGANRLGGNSMLGAIFAGQVAAQDIAGREFAPFGKESASDEVFSDPNPRFDEALGGVLADAMGILRNGEKLADGLARLAEFAPQNARERSRLALAEAMIRSAELRRESRGAHYREDYPQRNDAYQKRTLARYDGKVRVEFEHRAKE